MSGARRHARLAAFLVAAGALAGWLVLYTVRHRPPPLPAGAEHAPGTDPALCLECHGPAGPRPRGANHPLSDRCHDCHARG